MYTDQNDVKKKAKCETIFYFKDLYNILSRKKRI